MKSAFHSGQYCGTKITPTGKDLHKWSPASQVQHLT